MKVEQGFTAILSYPIQEIHKPSGLGLLQLEGVFPAFIESQEGVQSAREFGRGFVQRIEALQGLGDGH